MSAAEIAGVWVTMRASASIDCRTPIGSVEDEYEERCNLDYPSCLPMHLRPCGGDAPDRYQIMGARR